MSAPPIFHPTSKTSRVKLPSLIIPGADPLQSISHNSSHISSTSSFASSSNKSNIRSGFGPIPVSPESHNSSIELGSSSERSQMLTLNTDLDSMDFDSPRSAMSAELLSAVAYPPASHTGNITLIDDNNNGMNTQKNYNMNYSKNYSNTTSAANANRDKGGYQRDGIQSVHISDKTTTTNTTTNTPNSDEHQLHLSLTSSTKISLSQPLEAIEAGDIEALEERDWNAIANAGDIIPLGRLGEGTGGSVTMCKLRHGSTVFALKEIFVDPSPELQKQILRELQFNRTCNSPHIVKYYGTFMRDGSSSIFIAMEYCSGGSLEAIYKRVKALGGRIGEKVLGKVAEGVLSGLSYLHDRRIIHRDIKPQNILLGENGQVKLCDFGVSGEVVNSLATTFTGTSYYMAPERIQGQPYTATCDVWSLGLTLLEVAQSRFPFLQEDDDRLMPIELLTFIVNMPAPELVDEPQEGIKWSDSFRHFLRCCLEKDPKKRASPRQMLSHPWMVGQRRKAVRMDKFVRECNVNLI